jgi:hypothetical protein
MLLNIGVPKLNRAELETACEDFSNIVTNFEACTVYKGTLSSGVEIAVVSTLVNSSQDWSKSMELNYRRKVFVLLNYSIQRKILITLTIRNYFSLINLISCMLQIATLSRINHKNFVNLIGYCEEEEPFSRMFILEYAPNGSLFEHLHGNNAFCFSSYIVPSNVLNRGCSYNVNFNITENENCSFLKAK